MRKFISKTDSAKPELKGSFIIGWTGMRGVVSLAAALSIPEYLNNGNPFPQRNLILFITFVVILLTLILQGLTLPYFIRRLEMMTPEQEAEELQQYKHLKYEMAAFALDQLKDQYGKALEEQPLLQKIAEKWEASKMLTEDTEMTADGKIIYLNILHQQRKWLIQKNRREGNLDEGIVRRHLHQLDMEEEKVRHL